MSFRRRPKEAAGAVGAVVAGLGNPGAAYRGTRHNLGFVAADALAERLHASIRKRDSGAQVGTAHVPGSATSVLLVKPQTFMNLSGKALGPLLRKNNVPAERLWVLYDEMDLPFGRLRIRRGGGPGGHNGIVSIIDALGGDRDFVRIRMGVGRPHEDAVDHVLGKFHEDERERAKALVDLAVEAVVTGLTEGLETAMNRYNGQAV